MGKRNAYLEIVADKDMNAESLHSNSGESSEASDGEGQGTKILNHVPIENVVEKARRGPVLEIIVEEIERDGEIWKQCVVGDLLDSRLFSTHHLQSWINRVWRVGNNARAIARDGNKYVIFVQTEVVRQFVLQENPWLVDAEWKPNTKLRDMKVDSILIWMHVVDLPTEYLNHVMARKFGNVAGRFVMADWEGDPTSNVRFMRIRVWINPHKPLIAGAFYKRDDGVIDWAIFSYEKVHRFCKKCGRICHTQSQCTHLNAEIEDEVNEQMEEIRREQSYEIVLDNQHNLFTYEGPLQEGEEDYNNNIQ
ncbi:hypothetical protein COLO4_07457 [Corchorus olitorius]|uniref:Zinc knuckle CX2CX4HX4C domain-containing protein n=1 Tax=Corchorus olitorius TaxID=93759 RepID=A0A1R3KJN5_9ROSI|nr:hypothetical protein COLO4_07457 [Corchorus olitorius]